MFRRVPVRILAVALAALATTLSLGAAAPSSPPLNEVLARAAEATAAIGTNSRIACQENTRQTVVVDPAPVALDWSHNVTPWVYRDIVASWSVTMPAPDRSDGWNERRQVQSLGPFQPFPGKRALGAREQAAIDWTMDAPAPLPRFATVFLSAANQPRFEFSKAGETEVQALKAWEVKFRETARRTLWGLPISGSLWIDPSTGRVVRSAIAVRGEAPFSDAMTVDYRPDPATGFYLPHSLTRRTHVTSERSWVESVGTFTECRVSSATAP